MQNKGAFMKNQILTGIFVLISSAISTAAPMAIGNVKFKDELVIINDKIVCTSYSAPVDDIRPETIVNGTIHMAFQKGDNNNFFITGELDGDAININCTDDGILNLSLRSELYSFSATGKIGELSQSLTVQINGRYRSVSCGVHSPMKK